MTKGLEASFEHPFGLALLLRDEADNLLREPLLDGLGLDIGDEAVLILAALQLLKYVFFGI